MGRGEGQERPAATRRRPNDEQVAGKLALRIARQLAKEPELGELRDQYTDAMIGQQIAPAGWRPKPEAIAERVARKLAWGYTGTIGDARASAKRDTMNAAFEQLLDDLLHKRELAASLLDADQLTTWDAIQEEIEEVDAGQPQMALPIKQQLADGKKPATEVMRDWLDGYCKFTFSCLGDPRYNGHVAKKRAAEAAASS